MSDLQCCLDCRDPDCTRLTANEALLEQLRDKGAEAVDAFADTVRELNARVAELTAERDHLAHVSSLKSARALEHVATIAKLDAQFTKDQAELASLTEQRDQCHLRAQTAEASNFELVRERATAKVFADEQHATIVTTLRWIRERILCPHPDIMRAREAIDGLLALSASTPKALAIRREPTKVEPPDMSTVKPLDIREMVATDRAVRRADLMRVAEKVREACGVAVIQDYSSRRSIEDSIEALDLAAIVAEVSRE